MLLEVQQAVSAAHNNAESIPVGGSCKPDHATAKSLYSTAL